MDREQSLDMAVGQIEKQFGKGAIMRLGERPRVGVEAIPTGALALDLAAPPRVPVHRQREAALVRWRDPAGQSRQVGARRLSSRIPAGIAEPPPALQSMTERSGAI